MLCFKVIKQPRRVIKKHTSQPAATVVTDADEAVETVEIEESTVGPSTSVASSDILYIEENLQTGAQESEKDTVPGKLRIS